MDEVFSLNQPNSGENPNSNATDYLLENSTVNSVHLNKKLFNIEIVCSEEKTDIPVLV